MTNLSVIENKISSIKKYLKILDGYKKYSREEIEKDTNIRGSLERYLYLAVQLTIDLASSSASYKNLRKPDTAGENFSILKEEEIIDNELSNKLIKMVGFRNVIAHDYTKIDYNIVYDVLHSGLKDIEEFIKIIGKL